MKAAPPICPPSALRLWFVAAAALCPEVAVACASAGPARVIEKPATARRAAANATSADTAGAPPAVAPDAAVADPAPRARVLFDRTSRFGRVLVQDEGPRRVMRFGSPLGAEQSEIVRGDPREVPLEYVRYALLGLAHHGHVARLLMVGLGGGTFSNLVHRTLPDVTIDVVEIDPVVVTAARRFFEVREDDRYRVHLADAAAFVAGDRGTYDFVLLDGYGAEEIPPALRSEGFFRAVARRLAPGGIVAANVAELGAEGMGAVTAFREVFAPFDCRQAPNDGNLVIFGAASPRAIDARALERWAAAWDARGVTAFSLRALLAASDRGPDCDRALGRPR